MSDFTTISLLANASSGQAASTALLTWIGQALLFGTALAALTWFLLSTALRKARPAVHALLWLVVIVKFIAPVGPGFSYSLASFASELAPWLQPARPIPPSSPSTVDGLSEAIFVISPTSEHAPALFAPQAQRAESRWSAGVPTILAAAYLVGLAIVACVRIYHYARFARAVRRLPQAHRETKALVENVAKRMRLSTSPDVRVSADSAAPFVVGGIRSTLVLPATGFSRIEEAEAVVLHELAHLRRHDLLVRYAQWLAGTLLYFWPVVAWVNRRIDLAREAACDEWALRCGSLSPGEYARCLLKCMRPRRSGWVAYAPAAMAVNAAHVERRIEMILNTTAQARRSRMTMLLGGVGLLGWTGFAMSGASASLPPSPKADEAATSPAKPARIAMFYATASGAPGDVSAGGPALPQWFAHAPNSPTPVNGAAGTWLTAAGAAGEGEPEIIVMREGQMLLPPTIGVDLDSDGQITPDEQNAYLVAMAMNDPARVMEKYPAADADGDGALSIAEASDLVNADLPTPAGLPGAPEEATGVPMMLRVRMNRGDATGECELQGDVHVQVEGMPASAAPRIMMFRGNAPGADDAGGATGHWTTEKDGATHTIVVGKPIVTNKDGSVTVTAEAAGPNDAVKTIRIDGAAGGDACPVAATAKKIVIRSADGQTTTETTTTGPDGTSHVTVTPGEMIEVAGMPAMPFTEPAAVWLMTQAMGDGDKLTADQVRTIAAPATDAALRKFLRRNPRSDENGDGVLTIAERDQYLRDTQSRRNQKLLERFPAADADGNGALTDDEIKAFFHSRVESLRTGTGETEATSNDGRRMRVITRTIAAPAAEPESTEAKP